MKKSIQKTVGMQSMNAYKYANNAANNYATANTYQTSKHDGKTDQNNNDKKYKINKNT